MNNLLYYDWLRSMGYSVQKNEFGVIIRNGSKMVLTEERKFLEIQFKKEMGI